MDKRTPSRSKKLAGSRASTPRFGIPSWIVRSSLGLVLIVAGALKLYQLAFESQDESMPALFLILFAEAELLGGIWMLSGVDAEKTRKWAVAAFAGLAISSLIQAFAGKCSCGCFGAIAVNPWSAAVFDLGAIALLLLSWPRATSGATTTRSRWLYVGLVSFSLVVTAGGWSQSTTVSLAGKATRGDRPVQETTLTFTGDSGRIVVRTDHDGHFRLHSVHPGLYAVSTPERINTSTRTREKADRLPAKRTTQGLRQRPIPQRTTTDGQILRWIEIPKCSEYDKLIEL